MMKSSPQKIVIVGNGDDWQEEKIIYFCRKADYLITADNGLALLHQFKIMPHLIIGDLDSVSSTLLPQYSNIPIERYPGKKDFPDSELGIQKAISMNPKEITLLAVTGNYFDHSFATIVNLFRYYQENIKIKIITSNSVIFPITRKISLTHLKGRRFSLFPLSPVKNISMSGAQYQFPRKNLKFTDYSLSNVIVEEKLEIDLEAGMLFCVLFDKGFQ